MTTRTPAEIAYDATRLSYGPIADPPAESDPWDAVIEIMLDAVNLRQPAHVDQPLTKDEETILNALLNQDTRTDWQDVQTPLVTFPDGSRIVGTHDRDGSPWCCWLQAEDGQFHCGPDGGMAGDWGGVSFEDLTLDQVEKLRVLFNSPILTTLVDTACRWCKE